MGLDELFHASVERYPDKTAIAFHGQHLSYAMLKKQVNGYAHFLAANTAPGDSVLVIARNSDKMIALMLACFELGRMVCPVSWRMAVESLRNVLNDTFFTAAFFEQEFETTMKQAKTLSGRSTRLYDLFAVEPCEENCPDVFPQADESIAIQYFTSGSTGKPKSIRHSHGNLSRYFMAYSKVSAWTAEDIYETQSNLFHMSGFSCFISLFVGGTLILMDRFQEEDFFRTMEREQCTRISLVPTLISKCLSSGVFKKYDFSTVRKIVYGGSAMPLAQVRRTIAECTCSLEQAYGTTETCNISVLSGEEHVRAVNDSDWSGILESAGRPIPGVEVKLIDEDGNDVGQGPGEVAVRSPFLFSDVTGSMADSITADGFYRTGDIGRIDEKGYIFLIDRKNDMIVSGGENVYPREVENCIAHMISDVAMTVVIGVPDPYWGEKIVAFVTRHPGSTVTEEQIINFCRQNMDSYKKPRRVIFLDRMPLNSNGKLSRKLMKEIYRRVYTE